MTIDITRKQQALTVLANAVQEAVAYFRTAEEDLFDGFQTAHDVLANIVYWHCEYVVVAQALVDGEIPPLQDGSIPEQNLKACECHQCENAEDLAAQLACQQETLAALLNQIPDWEICFPIRQGGLDCTVEDRVYGLAASIQNHVAQLRQAAHGVVGHHIWN